MRASASRQVSNLTILYPYCYWWQNIHDDTCLVRPPGGGVLPYMGYMGTYRWIGYGFWPLCPEQGISFQASLSWSDGKKSQNFALTAVNLKWKLN